MKLGLREKVVVPVVAMFMISVGGVGTIALQQSGSLFRERSSLALDRSVKAAADRIDGWFKDRKTEIEAFAMVEGVTIGLTDPTRFEAASRQLETLGSKLPFVQTFLLLDSSGKTAATADPKRKVNSYADRAYFRKAIAGASTLSEPVVSKVTGKPVVVAAAPVTNPGPGVAGIVLFSIGLDDFAQTFLSMFATDSFSYAFVFQLADGKIVAHPDTSLILKTSLDSLEVGSFVHRAMDDETVVTSVGGRLRQIEFATIPTMGWGLAVVHDMEAENARLTGTRWLLIGISLAAAVLASLIVFLWVVRPMVRSLREALEFAQAVGEGDISISLQARSSDEIGDLVRTLATMGANLRLKEESVVRIAARDLTVDPPTASKRDALGNALRTMVGNLRDVLGKARDGAVCSEQAAERFQRLSMEVAGAAEETSSQSRILAKASDMVHQNVQAVAAGTEEMGASIREIARSASETSRVASEAVVKAERTNALVIKLGEASDQIGAVVEVISGIAGQTNLLALNATIEAARAGEAGKGFAVVAGEVKELSKATAAATSDIATKIHSIQEQMAQAVGSIQEISNVIRNVDTLSQSIAAAVEEQTAATGEISHSIAEASRGIGEINNGLGQAAEAADQTARSAAEIRVGSDELRSQAAKVSAEVSVFRLS